jgi:hypothetical protein
MAEIQSPLFVVVGVIYEVALLRGGIMATSIYTVN